MTDYNDFGFTAMDADELAAIDTKIIEKTGFDEVMVIDDSLLSGHSSEYNSIKDAIQYKNR